MAQIFANDVVVNPGVATGATRIYANDVTISPAVSGASRLYANDVTVNPAAATAGRIFANDVTVLGGVSLPVFRRSAGVLEPLYGYRRVAGTLRLLNCYRRVNGQLIPEQPGGGLLLAATTITAAIGNGQVTVTWTGVSGATGYQVARTGIGSNGVGPISSTESATQRTKLFANLANGTAYTFTVQPLPGGPIASVTVTPQTTAQANVLKPMLATSGGNYSGQYTTALNQWGPLRIHRCYLGTAANPTSWSQIDGGPQDVAAGRITQLSYKHSTAFTTSSSQQAVFSAFLDTIPAGHQVQFIEHHEPENSLDDWGGFNLAAIKVWGDMNRVFANIIHAKNRPEFTVGPCTMGPWPLNSGNRDYAIWNTAYADTTNTYMPWDVWDFFAPDMYSSRPPGQSSPLERLFLFGNSGDSSSGTNSLINRVARHDLPIEIPEWGRWHKQDPVPPEGRTPIPEAEVVAWMREGYAWMKEWNAAHPLYRDSNGKIRGMAIRSALWFDFTLLGADTPLTGIERTAYGELIADSKIASGGTAPVANFVANRTSGSGPLSVTFTSTTTGGATAFLWSFSDGTTSTAQNPTKTFSADATVTLRASNTYGASVCTKVDYIQVN